MEIEAKRLERIVKIFCVYDVLALAPFALPFVNLQQIGTLSQINEILGGAAWSNFSPVNMVFVQLLGLLGAAWAIWRWISYSVQIARFEGVLRLLFVASYGVGYMTTHSPILLVFAAIDLPGGILHLMKIRD